MLPKKLLIISVIIIALTINILSFIIAYPVTFSPMSTELARDFSAYYIGAWRLFHNPTAIYDAGFYPGDYPITPTPQVFKYAPSFFLWFSPFLAFSYQNAFTAFDLLQAASIFVLAFFVYKLVKDKSLILGAVATFLVIVAPVPGFPITPNEYNSLSIFFHSLCPLYYDGYALGNAHVIQAAFIVGAFYFGFAKKPWSSAIFFALSAFDPRGSLIALPLLLWYNRKGLWQFIAGSIAFITITNLPFFFYYNIGFTFLQKETNGNIVSQMYGYDWISVYVVVALSIIEILSIWQLRTNREIKSKILKTLLN